MKRYWLYLCLFLFLLSCQRRNPPKPLPSPLPEKNIIKATHKTKELDLAKGINLAFWENIPATKVKLQKQQMYKPFSQGVTSYLEVKAYHTNTHLYLFFQWEDKSESRQKGISRFPDAVAIMFGTAEKEEPPASEIIMGSGGKAYIWQWRADLDSKVWKTSTSKKVYVDFHYPFEKEEVFSLIAPFHSQAVISYFTKGMATLTKLSHQLVQGRGIWKQGKWFVVMKAPLAHPKSPLSFQKGKTYYTAFAVWEGDRGETGGRKSYSGLRWIPLKLE